MERFILTVAAEVSSGHSRHAKAIEGPNSARGKGRQVAAQDSMSDKRQKNQLQMALAFTGGG